jgi:hypothetical protein
MKRQIINQLSNKTFSQEDELNKIRKIELLTPSNSYFKQKNELILLENHLITEGYIATGTQFRTKYIFNNLQENDLVNIIPYSYLNTSPGYSEYHTPGWPAWSVYSATWWQTYEDKLILHVVADGYLYYEGSSNLCPIYVTIKILIRNPKLFDLTIKKSS